jgi:hypothetical protein
VHVDAAVEGLEAVAAHALHQRVAGHHAPCILCERQQQRELVSGERTLLARDPHRERVPVDFQTAEAQHGHFSVASAEDGAQPREQLAGVEGLREVVVGAELETDDAVGVLAPGGEHQDRNPTRRALLYRLRSRHHRGASRRAAGRRSFHCATSRGPGLRWTGT